jgi:hypothetical protein
MATDISRRRVLAGVAVAVGGLAGCSGEPTGGDESSPTGATTTAPPDATTAERDDTTAAGGGESPGSTSEATTASGDLDLREANVVGVAVERRDGDYRFDVTLYHDDDGEDGYANWWQVETRAGEKLGRRELLHAHGTQEFTRSATISVPEGVTDVVVRGHDQTHGYGGQAMLVNVGTGETTAVRQGPEPQSFEE